MPAALFSSEFQDYEEWRPALLSAYPELDLRLWPDVGDPRDIDVLLVWTPPAEALRFPNLTFVQTLGAGIDHLAGVEVPAHVQLARLVDPKQIDGFVEFVASGVLSFHRDLQLYAKDRTSRIWRKRPRRLAADRKVGIMGLGEMGQPCAERLASFGFSMRGWSLSRKDVLGVSTYAGEAELSAFLRDLDILVCALPLTETTRGILDRKTFAQLAPRACVINVGRGGHCVESDLLDAIRSGRVEGALLDVTDLEPLPDCSPLWEEPRIQITPHIATSQIASSAAVLAAENIRRVRAGAPPVGLIDRSRQY
ncbi:hypothetical protein UP09_05515 [Bradyrhizobium sp. LTSP885]|uniref:2-hydroxyacid dehydrogenase n=1 Tax=Bradyrhizobium sp. LTSP885 TaxID=1619232 RepID=UPI0005C9FE7B|nr:glyoxylate/hydroxypyruvate reductase A [Bradyrhizobium sp. LTSP885]KJC50464.1 hypothetical protein UP09_05515 [Bradyrhizobium sp. LTSP885]